MIVVKHPEATDFIGKIDQVLAQPDEVRRSVRDARVVLFYRFDASVLGGKRIVVVVKRVDRHFVSTVYTTDQIKSGEVIWIKNT